MKILIVCSGNANDFSFSKHQSFIYEQIQSVVRNDLSFTYQLFTINKKGVFGYLSEIPRFLSFINKYHPDVIHAHFGLCGLFANLQRRIPVVTSYHGSDINAGGINLFLSRFSMFLSNFNIFVGENIYYKSGFKKNNYIIQPCGVDLNVFYPKDKMQCRIALGMDKMMKYILFSGAFANKIKNSQLAKEAASNIDDCELVELKGYDREHVNLLMNSVDALLLTSFSEASPMVIKEAMACGCPIVSVDVGDVKDVIKDTDGCYISPANPIDLAHCLTRAISFSGKTMGRAQIIKEGLDINIVAKQIINIYNQVVSGKTK